MARTAKEISDAILAYIAADPVLGIELTSGSKTAIFKLLADVFGIEGNALESTFDIFAENLQESLLNQRVGTSPWYIDESKLFQYGDSLVYEGDGKFGYAEIDEDKQIVKRAAVVVGNSTVLLKVAKLDGSGNPIPLITAELTAFEDYWEEKDFQPSFLDILTATGDDITITANVELDPQVFNTVTGERISDGTLAVEDAIDNYIATFTDQDFDGTFYNSELVSRMLSVVGVTNVVTTAISANPDGGTPIDVLAESGKKYNAYAGYFKTATKNITYS